MCMIASHKICPVWNGAWIASYTVWIARKARATRVEGIRAIWILINLSAPFAAIGISYRLPVGINACVYGRVHNIGELIADAGLRGSTHWIRWNGQPGAQTQWIIFTAVSTSVPLVAA